jgi:hypothetical protein
MERYQIARLPVTISFKDTSDFKETYGNNQNWEAWWWLPIAFT